MAAWVAEERDHIAGQELTECEGRTFSDLARRAEVRGLEAWEHPRFFRQRNRAPSPGIWLTRAGRSPGRRLMAKKQSKPDWWPKDIKARICVWGLWILPAARVVDPPICK